jgi:7-carboxy-7-deazaguanine synthase
MSIEKEDMIVRDDSLLLSGDKCFFTIQGEGLSFGKPAIFLRLHLCNLRCSWCDTPYTWNRQDERFWSEPERWSLEKTIEEISKFPCKRLVITGGEPTLQRNALDKLIDMLDEDWKIEIETNGTLEPTETMIKRNVQINCSPKIENSGNPKELRYRTNVLKKINGITNSIFKFVVNKPEDLEEIEKIIKECEIDEEKIVLMPEGITQEDIAEHGRLISELCKEKGWRLIPRLHIMLWGNTRSK